MEQACRSIQSAVDLPSLLMDPTNQLVKRPKLDGSADVVGGKLPPLQLSSQLLAAYDHSDLCNLVFMHNHASFEKSSSSVPSSSSTSKKKSKAKFYKPRQTPIERITQQELESHSAIVWCMSPPCQPHTRQHSNQHKELEDPRSKSFLHLCHVLSVMEEDTLPCLILLENVVGFESSWMSACATADASSGDSNEADQHQPSTQQSQESEPSGSFQMWRKVLAQREYQVGHFHLDPTHLRLPNNRPRYYCVAFRRGSLQARLMKSGNDNIRMGFNVKKHNLFTIESLSNEPVIHTEKSIQEYHVVPTIPNIKSFLDADISSKKQSLQIPEKVRMSSSAWCFDLVTPYHLRSSCFTHSYGKFIRGTGSILYYGQLRLGDSAVGDESNSQWSTVDLKEDNRNVDENDTTIPTVDKFQLALPEERSFEEDWSAAIDWDTSMRYLSGTEIARLMGFPVSEPAVGEESNKSSSTDGAKMRMFSFPQSCAMKQQWKLLGNSLNVRVAATVAEIGISSILSEL